MYMAKWTHEANAGIHWQAVCSREYELPVMCMSKDGRLVPATRMAVAIDGCHDVPGPLGMDVKAAEWKFLDTTR